MRVEMNIDISDGSVHLMRIAVKMHTEMSHPFILKCKYKFKCNTNQKIAAILFRL